MKARVAMRAWWTRLRLPLELAAVVAAAALWPRIGRAAQAAVPVKEAAIVLIFVNSGLSLSMAELRRAGAGALREHAIMQALIFGFFPVAVALTRFPFAGVWGGQIAFGLSALAVIPTTISSSIVFTGLADGNRELALINAVGSNLAGIVLSPLLLALLVQVGDAPMTIDAGEVLLSIGGLVVLPFVAGQLIRLIPAVRERVSKAWLSTLNTAAVILIVYVAFCRILGGTQTPRFGPVLFALFAYLVVLHAAAVTAGCGMARLFRLPRADAVAVIFVSSQKTLAMGVPLVTAFCRHAPGMNPDTVALPLMIYYPMQLLAASFVKDILRRRGEHDREMTPT